ncbi:MAG: PQQ-binding-like beta-propeller repeat protein [Nitrospirota bacterium]
MTRALSCGALFLLVQFIGPFAQGPEALAAQAGDGHVIYGNRNASTTLYNRSFNGTTFGLEGALLLADFVRWTDLEASPTDADRLLRGVIEKGTKAVKTSIFDYSTGTWTEITTVTSSTGNDSRRLFDIEFEEGTGDALIVYASSTAGALRYRTLSSACAPIATCDWSAQQTLNFAGGTPRTVRAARDPDSDDVLVAWEDSNFDVFSALWNGSSFGGVTIHETNSINAALDTSGAPLGPKDSQVFDLAWEGGGSTSEAMVAWMNSVGVVRYNTWTGGAWGLSNDLPGLSFAVGDKAGGLVVASTRWSAAHSRIAIFAGNGNEKRIKVNIWSGTGWGAAELLGSVGSDMRTDKEGLPLEAVWQATTGNLFVPFIVRQNDIGVRLRIYDVSSDTWGVDQGPLTGTDIFKGYVRADADRNSQAVGIVAGDKNVDIGTFGLICAHPCSVGTAAEWTTTEINTAAAEDKIVAGDIVFYEAVSPAPVTDLTITSYNAENVIFWANPATPITHILVLAKTSDCTFGIDPGGAEGIGATVGNAVVIYNNNPATDLSSTPVTVGGPTAVSYTAATQRLVHSGLTDGTVYCYKVYARNGSQLDDNSGAGRPAVSATGTDGVAPSAVWTFNLVSSVGASLVQPSLDPGVAIYTSYGSGTIASIGATDGLLSWRATPAAGAIQDQSAIVWMSGSSTCGIGGATTCLFAASQDGYVYARNAVSGAGTWSYRHAAGDVLQGALAVQIKDYSNAGYMPTVDRLFAATRNTTTIANKVYALDPTTAPPTIAWLFTGGGVNPAMDMVSSPPALDYANNRLYVTSHSNGGTQRSLWVFSTVDGALLSTGASYGGTSLGDVAVPPALSVDGSVVYAGTTTGTIAAYNTIDGSLRWSFAAGSAVASGLWVEFRAGLAGNLFFSTANGRVWRIRDDGASATDIWGAGAPTVTAASFPVVIPSAGKVYVGGCSGANCAAGSQGRLYQLDVATGAKEQCRNLGANVTVGDPAFDTVFERLLVGASDGKVHTYAAPAGILGGDPSCTP